MTYFHRICRRGFASAAAAVSTKQAPQSQSFTIPVIEFGKFLKGNTVEKQDVANQVLDAFKKVGFIYLADHGIPQSQVDTVFDFSKRFFDLPSNEKMKLSWVSPESNRGYVAPGREKVTQLLSKDEVDSLRESSPDLKESLEIGKEPSTDYQNNWPENFDPAFRPTMMNFYETCHQLQLELMDAIGLGLGLHPRFFDNFCNNRDHNLRLLHYPSVPRNLLDRENQSRAGAHSDYGTVTLLFQDDRGGLQVKTPLGHFQDATPIKGTIVVNAGDLLSRWSNDIIKSTEHRVISPPVADPSATHYPARYSIAYFSNPNWDATIQCLEGCHSETNPPKYAPVQTHEYLVQRLSATY